MKIRMLICLISLTIMDFAQAANWRPIVTCDKNELIVKVNTDERRQLQLTIHNRNVVKWFGCDSAVKCPYYNYPCLNSTGSLEVIGDTAFGVFEPWQFSYMRASEGLNAGDDGLVVFTAKMEGNSIKVALMADTKQLVDCGPNGEGPCSVYTVPIPYREFRNWVFNNCVQMNQ